MGQDYPPPVLSADLVLANANAGKPRYTAAGAAADWAGGVKGDDVSQATAMVALATSDGDVAEADYAPRTQQAKATATGNTLAKDVTTPRGSIPPGSGYPIASTPVPAAPVVTSLSPTTAAAAVLPLTVTITGTGFTPASTVYTGGQLTPDVTGVYVNATTMRVAIFKATPGTVSVAVKDHDVLSNANVVFTVT